MSYNLEFPLLRLGEQLEAAHEQPGVNKDGQTKAITCLFQSKYLFWAPAEIGKPSHSFSCVNFTYKVGQEEKTARK